MNGQKAIVSTTVIFRSSEGKICRKCFLFFIYELFPKENRNKDGKAAICKKCDLERSSNWAKNKGKEKRAVSVKRYQQSEKGRESFNRANRKATKKWVEANRFKVKCHVLFRNYLKLNKLERPKKCSKCGVFAKIEAHHCDYLKPLDVIWLCKKCHYDWHKNNGEGLNGKS